MTLLLPAGGSLFYAAKPQAMPVSPKELSQKHAVLQIGGDLWQGGGAAPSRLDSLPHRIASDFHGLTVREGQG